MRRSNHKLITERLFEEYGPLGNIRSRIDVAYALEVIDTPMYKDLVMMNKIRVKFAHSLNERKFGDTDIADLLYKLSPAGKKPAIPRTYIDKAIEIASHLNIHFSSALPAFTGKPLDT